MYDKCKNIIIPSSSSAQVKNLQVVSFDADWREVYVGYVRKDVFTGECPNNVNEAAKISVKYGTKDRPENAVISAAKWCPMESCTLLVLGSQYGLQIYDWNGSILIYDYDFAAEGVGPDEKQITGPMVKGIAAIGSSFITAGLHTGEIVMFNIGLDDEGYKCSVVGRFRQHVASIMDVASSNVASLGHVLVSGDVSGTINTWSLTVDTDSVPSLVTKDRIADWSGQSAVTTLAVWSKYRDHGVVVAGYGSGHIRLFSLLDGHIMAEIAAHNGWITGMDLASHSGLLLSCAEDSYVRVWQLNNKGALVEHWFSSPIHDCLMTGAKFLDPRGSSFCISSYDSASIQLDRNWPLHCEEENIVHSPIKTCHKIKDPLNNSF